MISRSKRAARLASVPKGIDWASPTISVRQTDAACVPRSLRRADRLYDQGERLAYRDSLHDVWGKARRAEARAQALELRALARVYADAIEHGKEAGRARGSETRDAAIDFAVREAAAEVAAIGLLEPRSAQGLLESAFDMVTRFEATVEHLEAGMIFRRHADKIHTVGIPLDDDVIRAEYERIVLEAAPTMTVKQLGRFALRVFNQLSATSLEQRHAEARKNRCVTIRDEDDGMATVTAYLPALQAYAIHGTITGAAREQYRLDAEAITDAKERGDTAAVEKLEADRRTLGALCVDILTDYVLTTNLATGGTPYGPLAAVKANIDVAVSTNGLLNELAGGDVHEVATVNGRVPIPVSAARELLATCTSFNRVQTDPFTGVVVSVQRRYATTRMREFLRIRDAHCRWPGCTLPAVRSELDHTVAVEHGGPTSLTNLEFFCKAHHLLKHQTRWQAEQLDGGIMRYTSPTGRIFTTTPGPADPDVLLGRPPGWLPPREDSALTTAVGGPPEFRPSDDGPPPF